MPHTLKRYLPAAMLCAAFIAAAGVSGPSLMAALGGGGNEPTEQESLELRLARLDADIAEAESNVLALEFHVEELQAALALQEEKIEAAEDIERGRLEDQWEKIADRLLRTEEALERMDDDLIAAYERYVEMSDMLAMLE